jgi:PIN domain nuclease of toxin-antitoxin system
VSKPYVLDACAIIALLKNEKGADIIDSVFVRAKTGDCSVSISKYNLLEMYYGFYREDGKDFAEQQVQAVKNSGITIIDTLSDAVFSEAGRLKAHYQISLADAIVLSHGIVDNAIIISSDHHEFDVVEQAEKISFLRSDEAGASKGKPESNRNDSR